MSAQSNVKSKGVLSIITLSYLEKDGEARPTHTELSRNAAAILKELFGEQRVPWAYSLRCRSSWFCLDNFYVVTFIQPF